MSTQIPEEFLKAIAQEHDLSDVEIETLMLALEGHSNAEIADLVGITEVGVRKRLGKVYKKFNIGGSASGKLTDLRLQLISQFPTLAQPQVRPAHRQDWSEAPDVSVFYGRGEELATLQQWVVKDKCRLVALLGLAGIGKTLLAVKLAKQIASEFEFVIWRSLRNAPLLQDITLNLVEFLSDRPVQELPVDPAGGLSQLMELLRQHRCLLIFDEVETILRSGDRFGRYLQGYEEYGTFLRRMGEEQHQSCLILTGQDKPREVALLQGENGPVRALQITGLKEAEARKLLQEKGLSGQKQWGNLIQTYRGNPLALKMIANTIQQVFNSDVDWFVEQHTILIGDIILDALDQQFNRLSELEKIIMRYLASQPIPVSLKALRENLSPSLETSELIRSLESLFERSMIEKTKDEKRRGEVLFTLQPVVKKYVVKQHLS